LADGSFPDKNAFIFSPFNGTGIYPTIAFYPKDVSVENGSSMTDASLPIYYPDNVPDNKAAYCNRIELLTGIMKNEQLHKCVLSRRIDLDEPKESLAPDLFSGLCNRYPDAFISLIHIPGVFTWLGATPEKLLKVVDQEAQTNALAATRPFEGVLPGFSEWNEKEVEEQQVVTDFILNVLEKENIQTVDCEGPYSVQAGNLVHLKTDIYFSITPRTDILSLIRALHPTPAVCGLPKDDALKMIISIEPHDREFYAGYLGLITKDDLELYVNLRCMRWLRGKPSLFVGGGITAASIPQQEWDETNFKAQTLLDVIEKLCNLAGKNPDAH
jgi:isochorismate synthase